MGCVIYHADDRCPDPDTGASTDRPVCPGHWVEVEDDDELKSFPHTQFETGVVATNACTDTPQAEINLVSVQAAIAAFEAQYPRHNIASYMKMNTMTRDLLLKRINPVQISTCGISAEPLAALKLSGVEIRVEDAMPDRLVQIYNADDELIEGCWL